MLKCTCCKEQWNIIVVLRYSFCAERRLQISPLLYRITNVPSLTTTGGPTTNPMFRPVPFGSRWQPPTPFPVQQYSTANYNLHDHVSDAWCTITHFTLTASAKSGYKINAYGTKSSHTALSYSYHFLTNKFCIVEVSQGLEQIYATGVSTYQ